MGTEFRHYRLNFIDKCAPDWIDAAEKRKCIVVALEPFLRDERRQWFEKALRIADSSLRIGSMTRQRADDRRSEQCGPVAVLFRSAFGGPAVATANEDALPLLVGVIGCGLVRPRGRHSILAEARAAQSKKKYWTCARCTRPM